VQFVPLRLLSAAKSTNKHNVTTSNAGNYILMAIYSADGTVKVLDAGQMHLAQFYWNSKYLRFSITLSQEILARLGM